MTAQDKARKTARDATFTRSDHAAPGERPDSTHTTRAAPRLKLEHKHSFLGQVLIGIEYFYVGCLTFLLGFLVSTSLPRLSSCLELQQCFGSEELTSDVARCMGYREEPTT